MNKAAIINNKDSKKTIRSKKNTTNAKPYLFTPLKLKWPQMESQRQEQILKKLKICLVEKNFNSSLLIVPAKDEKNKVYRPLNQISLSEEDINIRSQLITGIKEVTRHAEKDNLKCIFCDKSSPWQLHRHLIQMAAMHNCRAAAFDNFSDLIAPLLNLSRLSAIAFRKTTENDSNYFATFIEEIEILIAPIDIPFLSKKCVDTNKIINSENTSNQINKCSDQQSSFIKTEVLNVKNYTNLEENSQLKSNSKSLEFMTSDAVINFIPDDICFLKKRKNEDNVLNDINDMNIAFIRITSNEENDSLFLKVPIFVPKKDKEIIEVKKIDIDNSTYIKSDVRKIEFSSKKFKNR